MNWLLGLTINTKIWLSNIILIALIVTLSLTSISALLKIEKNTQNLNKGFDALDLIQRTDKAFYQVVMAERKLIFSKPRSAEFVSLLDKHAESVNSAVELINSFKSQYVKDDMKQTFSKFEQYFNEWQQLTNQIKKERKSDTRAGRSAAIDISFGSASDKFDEMREQVKALISSISKKEKDLKSQSEITIESSIKQTTSLLIACIIVAALVSLILPKLIVNPLLKLRLRLEELSSGKGDLTQKVEIDQKGEIGQLGHSVNSLLEGLRELISNIKNAGESFQHCAQKLHSGAEKNKEVSDGTLEEITLLASSITEMSASVHEVARNTSHAAEQSQQASDASHSSFDVVTKTKASINNLAHEVQSAASSIEKLRDDSTNIDKVVNVIRDIAEQTNLLALNAAIEAARAGEQGRGFAVVADEVRALASRTQESTQEIQNIIGDLQTRAAETFGIMEKGQAMAVDAVEQANVAGETIDRVNNIINLISDNNIQIAAATEEQSAVSDEISKNAIRLSDYSSEATEVSGSVNKASDDISAAALELQNLLTHFKV